MPHDWRVGGFVALEDYDGYEFVFENGCYARIVFKRDAAQDAVHPYKYSLTLHAPSGKRLVGFDNAHSIRRLSGKFTRRSLGADHWHRDAADKGRPYEFKSPELLLEDFFHEVDRVLGELGVDVARVEMRKR